MGGLSGSGSDVGFEDWPYAVRMQQSVEAGVGVETCYKTVNGNEGAVVPLAAGPTGAECACAYMNYGF